MASPYAVITLTEFSSNISPRWPVIVSFPNSSSGRVFFKSSNSLYQDKSCKFMCSSVLSKFEHCYVVQLFSSSLKTCWKISFKSIGSIVKIRHTSNTRTGSTQRNKTGRKKEKRKHVWKFASLPKQSSVPFRNFFFQFTIQSFQTIFSENNFFDKLWFKTAAFVWGWSLDSKSAINTLTNTLGLKKKFV